MTRPITGCFLRPGLLLALVIIIAGLWLIRKLSVFLNSVLLKRKIDASLRPFLSGSVSLVLQVLLVFAVMQIPGIELTVFAALTGAFGVAAGLALSGTLQNFTSGLLILLLKPFRAGDNIISQGMEGTVTTIRIFYTIVTTFDNRTVVIPNSKLSNEVIINLSREGKRRPDIELKLNFSEPFTNVKAVIEKTINANSALLKEPVSRIGLSGIEKEFYIVMVNVWIKAHEFLDIKMQRQEALVDDLLKAGINFPEK